MVDDLIAMHLQNYQTARRLIMGLAFCGTENARGRLNDGATRVLAGDQVFLNVERTRQSERSGLEAARTAHEYRGSGARLLAATSDRARRRLCPVSNSPRRTVRFGSRVTVIQHGPQLMAGGSRRRG